MPDSTNSHAAPESYWTAFPHSLPDLCTKARESGKRELMEEFRARAEALGLSLSDLAAAGSPKAGRPSGKGPPAQSPAVKYRNPETGETWSGRGRAPKWLTLAERQGRGREEFAATKG